MRTLADSHTTMRLTSYSRMAGIITFVVGCLVLLGWRFDIALLKNGFPGVATMKSNTALGFILSGLVLAQLHTWKPRLLSVCSAGIAAIGVLTLLEYAFRWDLGIDQWFVRDLANAETAYAGRMSPISALNFLLLGSSLLLCSTSDRRKSAQSLTLAALFMALLSLIGHLYGVQLLYQISTFSSISLHTAMTFILLCLGLLFAYPQHGLAAELITNRAGGMLARQLLPAAIILPILFGWLIVHGQQANLYDTDFGLALFAVANIAAFSSLIFWTTHVLNRVDTARNQAMEALHQANDQLEARVLARTADLKLLNQQLEVAITEQQRQAAHSRALLASVPDAIIIVNADGQIVLVNAQTEQRFGYTRDELVGHTVEILIPEALRSRHIGHRVGYVADPHVRGMGVGVELYALQKDGTQFPVEVRLSPIETADGTLIASSVRDISEHKQAEAEIRRLNTELEQRVMERTRHLTANIKEMESFSYAVSHDLRTPLRALAGYAQVLKDDYAAVLDSEGQRYLGRIQAATQRMGHLIDGILQLSRLSRTEMAHTPVDLSTLARDVAAEIAQSQSERQVQLIVVDHLVVEGDALLLRVALQNLIGNAWKFTQRQAHPRIEVGMTLRHGRPVYFVRDNGVGFDMAYSHKLFNAFQRLHTTDDFEGVGIGLATAQRIIQRHGGEVWAEGTVDRGATFYFTL